MDFDNIEVSYIGEEEAIDDVDNNEDLNEDYEPRSIRVNSNGKKVRGKDLHWTKKINFNNAKQYKDSNIVEDLEDNYTLKRSNEYEYGTVHNYICKYNQKTRYQPCRKELRVVFPSDSLEVYVQETNIHEHILNPEYVDKAAVYRWTKAATETILTGRY